MHRPTKRHKHIHIIKNKNKSLIGKLTNAESSNSMNGLEIIYMAPFIPWAWFKSHWPGASHMYHINISQTDYNSTAINSETKLFLTCVHRNGIWQLNSLLPKERGKKWDWADWVYLYHFTSLRVWYFTLLFCPAVRCHSKYPIRIQWLMLVI